MDIIGRGCPIPPADPKGYSPLHCWVAFESTGQVLPCTDPTSYAKARRSLASWRLQLKQWAEGVADETLSLEEVISYISDATTPQAFDAPEWFLPTTITLAGSYYRRAHRTLYVPTFMRILPT